MAKRVSLIRRLKQQSMRSSLGQAVGARWGRVLTPERWVFIIGCYNSGTTLLKDLLSEHPHIGALAGEGVKFSDGLPRPEDFGWQRMWCQCVDQVRLNPEDRERADRIKRQWSMLYPARPVLLEKSIVNAVHIPFLKTHFKPAHFIYIVRNGYAVAEGIRRKAEPGKRGNPVYGGAYPIGLCARQWAETERMVEREREGLSHFMSLRYEEFVADPDVHLRRITDFSGVDPLDGRLLAQDWNVHGVESTIRNMNGPSLARLSDADRADVLDAAGDVLERWGYGPEDSA